MLRSMLALCMVGCACKELRWEYLQLWVDLCIYLEFKEIG